MFAKENLLRTQEFIRGTLYNGSIIVDGEEPPYKDQLANKVRQIHTSIDI